MAGLAYTLVALAPVALTAVLLAGLDVPWLAVMVGVLAVRQLTVFTVTALYHRGHAHGSVRFHPVAEAVLRAWGWLATGLGVRTWAIVHRWHHALGDDVHAPFSPSRPGGSALRIGRETLAAHWRVVCDPTGLERFAKGLPDDVFERFVSGEERRAFGVLGLRLPLVLALGTAALSTVAPPGTAFLATLASIPGALGSVAVGSVFGVNGIAHLAGTRRFDTPDTSHNVLAVDLLGLGEGLHNNHHARPGSARLSAGPGEVDAGFAVLRALRAVGIVRELRYGP